MSAAVLLALAQVLGPLLAAAAAYGGVRAGLKGLEGRVKRLERECDRAHDRIDRVFQSNAT